MLKGVEMVAKDEYRYHEKWVVALTDGADTASYPTSVQAACKLMERTPKVNLALITVSGEEKSGGCCTCTPQRASEDVADMRVVRQYLKSAYEGEFKGTCKHIEASSPEAISAAFDSVSSAMEHSGALFEVL